MVMKVKADLIERSQRGGVVAPPLYFFNYKVYILDLCNKEVIIDFLVEFFNYHSLGSIGLRFIFPLGTAEMHSPSKPYVKKRKKRERQPPSPTFRTMTFLRKGACISLPKPRLSPLRSTMNHNPKSRIP